MPSRRRRSGVFPVSAGLTVPKSADSFLDMVGINIATNSTGNGNRVAYNDTARMLTDLSSLYIRNVRSSWYYRTADVSVHNALKNAGFNLGYVLWDTPGYLSLLNDGHPVPSWLENMNEPIGWNEYPAIALQNAAGAVVGTHQGAWDSSKNVTAGDTWTTLSSDAVLVYWYARTTQAAVSAGPPTGLYASIFVDQNVNWRPAWVQAVLICDQRMTTLLAKPGWSGVTPISPSTFVSAGAAITTLTNTQRGNYHLYPRPANTLVKANWIGPTNTLDKWSNQSTSWVTELGWSSPAPLANVISTSEQTHAISMIRELLGFHRQGIEKVCVYELYDEPASSFGVNFMTEGLMYSPGNFKTPGRALRHLMGLFRGSVANLQPIWYNVTDASGKVESYLLRHSDGRYMIPLWRNDAMVSDPTAARGAIGANEFGSGNDLIPAPVSVTVQMPTDFIATLHLIDGNYTTSVVGIGSSFTIQVGRDPVVLVLQR